MTRKVIEAKLSRPNLLIPREEAKQKIEVQIEKGKGIRDITINDDTVLQNSLNQKEKWINFTTAFLESIFENEYYANEFKHSYGAMRMAMNFFERVENLMNDLNAKITNLESLREMLEIIQVSNSVIPLKEVENNTVSKNIFIVHGHDDLVKTELARFIEKLGLNPIILHEQPHQGMTLIEKLEHHSDVGFAIIIITPDDEGYPKGEPEKIRTRARQNVVAELGFFVGKLKRKKVCVLYKENVEIPTDFDGIGYYAYDDQGAWKILIGKELKEAGFQVDLNQI